MTELASSRATVGQWVMIIVYGLLVMLWYTVLVLAAAMILRKRLPFSSAEFRWVERAFLTVAAILTADSLYWAMTNSFHVLAPTLEEPLRNPWLVASVKSFTLLSGCAFMWILVKTYPKLNDQLEDKYFGKVIDLTKDAIGILDQDGRMKYWNTGAERLFRWDRNEVRGQHIKSFMVPPDLHGEMDKTLEKIRATREAHRNPRTSRMTKDGRRIPIDITITPIIDDEFRGYFGVMRPVQPAALEDGGWLLFGWPQPLSEEAYAFVAMPFSPSVIKPDVYEVAIRDAVASHGIVPVRVDEQSRPGLIASEIFSYISYANVVIADLTGSNPNVYYEVGLAHALNKPVIQLMGDGGRVYFDVAGIRTLKYDPNRLDDLRERLGVAIGEVLGEQPNLGRHFGTREK